MLSHLFVAAKPSPHSRPPGRSDTRDLPPRPYIYTPSLYFQGLSPPSWRPLCQEGYVLVNGRFWGSLCSQLMARATALPPEPQCLAPRTVENAEVEVGNLYERGLWRNESSQPFLCAPHPHPVLRLEEPPTAVSWPWLPHICPTT